MTGTFNGREYIGLFKIYYRKYDLYLEKIIPKISQHNGVTKRINRTISEIIGSMLSHAKLSMSDKL